MNFANPEMLFLLAAVPILGAWEWWRSRKNRRGIRFSDVRLAGGIPRTIWTYMGGLPALLRMGALAFGIVAMARPQQVNTSQTSYAEGVDIMLLIDTSSSMRAQDFLPNRFEAAKEVATDFINGRSSDRIGLIVFAAQAYTQAPLTLDYNFLQEMMREVEIGVIEDGTAIGSALATSVNRLRDSEAKSKVVILLTDGQNNRGEVDPSTAADVAAALDVRVYTIGVGAKGTAPYVYDDAFFGQRVMQMPVEIDEEMLGAVAEKTGGKYFRATNKRMLRSIYEDIGDLEKTRIEELIYTNYRELYHWFIAGALALLMLEVLLSNTVLRRLP